MQKRVEFFLILIFLTQKYANEERKKGKWENIKKQTQSVLRGNYYFFITAFDVTIKLRINCRCKKLFFL